MSTETLLPAALPGAVRRWRAASGLSLVEAGRLLGVAHTTVRDWENGRRPRDIHLARLQPLLNLGSAHVQPAHGHVVPLPTPLRLARTAQGMTMAQLARHSHVCLSTVSLWERGLRQPDPSHLPQLAGALRVSTEQVAGLFEHYPPNHAPTVTLPGLKSLRLAAGISQRALAGRLGISTGTLAGWEVGRTPVPAAQLPAIRDALGCTSADLLALGARPVRYLPRATPVLAQLRLARGLSQRTAAGRLGVSVRSLADVENGRRPITLALCRAMTQLYGCGFRRVAEAGSLPADPLLDRRRWTPGSLPAVLGFLRHATGEHLSRTAAGLGVRPATVRRWEQGASTPSIESIARLERYFGLARHELQRLLLDPAAAARPRTSIGHARSSAA